MFSRLAGSFRNGRQSRFRSFSQRTHAGFQSGRMIRCLVGSGLAATLVYTSPWDALCQAETKQAQTQNRKKVFSPSLKDINNSGAKKTNLYLFVGTYTEKLGHCPDGKGKGIHVFRVNPSTGALTEVHVEPMRNPSYLTLGLDQDVLYSVDESEQGSLAAFKLSKKGKLTPINQQPTCGASPCYIQIAGDSPGYALVANYMSGSIVSMALQSDGSVGGVADFHQHFGKGINPVRQEGSHPHAASMPDTLGENVFVPDLGLDQVRQYKFNPVTGVLAPNPKEPYCTSTVSGAGPRHLKFHPNKKSAYVVNELDSSVTHYRYLGHTGRLFPMQTISTLPQTVSGPQTTRTANTAADIQIHPSGDFLYVSNRGDDSIAAFSLDDQTGRPSPIGHVHTNGKTPRNFCMDPSGRLVYVANQDSDSLQAFVVQPDGTLKSVSAYEMGSPCMVKMAWL